MPQFQIAIDVADEFAGKVEETRLEVLALALLDSEGAPDGAEVSIIVEGDDVLRALNRAFRGHDEPADVLSFPLDVEQASPEQGRRAPGEPDGPFQEGFARPPDGADTIGEIYISYPQAEAKARKASYQAQEEIEHLLTHGLLHLLGYDHEEPEDWQRMLERESAVLGECWGLASSAVAELLHRDMLAQASAH
jgi:probable rRNA maturation factor